MNMCSVPMCITFRCLEAMHGTPPTEGISLSSPSSSLAKYVLYARIPIDLLCDHQGEFLRSTWKQVFSGIRTILLLLLSLSIACSAFLPMQWVPFDTVANRTTIATTNVERNYNVLKDIFQWGHLGNNLVAARKFS
mmetsp:Transcript_2828/g.3779  ORF Transcript_2828/g.3779 Transcript_2828/m.3779 type:complete len:136 (-) Transcript_2828:43-450(-)